MCNSYRLKLHSLFLHTRIGMICFWHGSNQFVKELFETGKDKKFTHGVQQHYLPLTVFIIVHNTDKSKFSFKAHRSVYVQKTLTKRAKSSLKCNGFTETFPGEIIICA